MITSPFTSTSIGENFRIKVHAYNREGETDSDIANIVLGDVPLAPTLAPVKVLEKSTTSALFVEFSELSEVES